MAHQYNCKQDREKVLMNSSRTVIYYNPKCSKCRTTLKLLREKEIEPEIVEYLSDTPSKAELKDVLARLGISADQLLRKKESAYRVSGLNEDSTEEDILNAMMKRPVLIERPVVIHGGKATIGRPPEKVLEIL